MTIFETRDALPTDRPLRASSKCRLQRLAGERPSSLGFFLEGGEGLGIAARWRASARIDAAVPVRAVLGMIFLLGALPAAAHGVETRILAQGAATVEFRFADGTPMAFAEALVTAPGAPDEPAAAGRTDRNGRFSFFPDRDGDWQVEVHDEGGHLARAVVTSAGGAIRVPRRAFPDWLVALSLVANVAAAGWFGRRRVRAASPAVPEARA
jgi:hypothetical protein